MEPHRPKYPIESGPKYFQRWDAYDADDDLKKLEEAEKLENAAKEARRKPPTPKDVQHLLDKQKDDSLQFLSRNTDLVTTVARKHKLDPEMLQACFTAIHLTKAELEALPSTEQMKANAIRTTEAFERERNAVRDLEMQRLIEETKAMAKASKGLTKEELAQQQLEALARDMELDAEKIAVCAQGLSLTQQQVASLPEDMKYNITAVREDAEFAALRYAARTLGMAPKDRVAQAADLEVMTQVIAQETGLEPEGIRTTASCLQMSEAAVEAIKGEAERNAVKGAREDPVFGQMRLAVKRLGLLHQNTEGTLEGVDLQALRLSLALDDAAQPDLGPRAEEAAAPGLVSGQAAAAATAAAEAGPAGADGAGQSPDAQAVQDPAPSPPPAQSSDGPEKKAGKKLVTPAYQISGGDAELTVRVELPLLEDMRTVSVDVDGRELRLLAAGVYSLKLHLPCDMSDHTVQAKFGKKTKVLTICLLEP